MFCSARDAGFLPECGCSNAFYNDNNDKVTIIGALQACAVLQKTLDFSQYVQQYVELMNECKDAMTAAQLCGFVAAWIAGVGLGF